MKKILLGDLIELHRGYDLPKKEQNSGFVPVLGSNGIIGFHDTSLIDPPVVTVGRSGNIGTPFICYEKSWPLNTTLYVSDFKGHDPEYIFYLLKTLHLDRFAGGSAVPTLNRNHLKNLLVSIPDSPQEEQKAVKLLALIDKKMMINERINKNLLDFYFP